MKSAQINDGRQRTVTFTNDLFGQVLRRDETGPATGSPHEVWYRFGGRQMGYVGNNGTLDTNYDQSITARTAAPGTGAFRGGAAYATWHADFDQSIAPITSYAQGGGGGSYTVQAGDTLSGIAQLLWGDGALWYRLAQANGLSGASALATGQVLSVPAGVSKSTHNAGTFEPYDAGRIIGDTSPGVAAAPQAKRNKCGAFGTILMIAVAVAIAVYAGPLVIGHAVSATASTATGLTAMLGGTAAASGSAAAIGAGVIGGSLVGAASSLGSQIVGAGLGIQKGIDWKGVALAGISGAVGGALGGAGILSGAKGAGAVLQGAGRAAIGNMATQGIAIATRLQSKFDFAGVAVAAATGAGVSGAGQFGVGGLLSGMAGAIAGGAARSIIDGSSFGDNVKAALPAVIGSVIGEMVATDILGAGHAEQGLTRAASKSVRANSFAEPSPITIVVTATWEQVFAARQAALWNDLVTQNIAYAVTTRVADFVEYLAPDIRSAVTWVSDHNPRSLLMRAGADLADRAGYSALGRFMRSDASFGAGVFEGGISAITNTVITGAAFIRRPGATAESMARSVGGMIDRAVMADVGDVVDGAKSFGGRLASGDETAFRAVGKFAGGLVVSAVPVTRIGGATRLARPVGIVDDIPAGRDIPDFGPVAAEGPVFSSGAALNAMPLPRSPGLGSVSTTSELLERGLVPGVEGVTLGQRTVVFSDLWKMSEMHGVEFALTKEAGAWRLYSGGVSRVPTPLGADTRILAHTHPGGTVGPSPGDWRALSANYDARLAVNPRTIPYPSRVIHGPGVGDYTPFFPTNR